MATQPMTNKNNKQTNSRESTAQSARSGQNPNTQRGQSAQSYADEAKGYIEKGNQQLRDMVEDHEGQTVLVALALGFGIGVALGYALAGPSQQESSHWVDRATAERLGKKLMQKMDQFLPEAVSSRMHG